MTKSYITKRGYVVYKKDLTEDQILNITSELTVTPNVPKDYRKNVVSFPVYMEGSKKLYLPKFYGINKFGPAINKLPDGVDIDIDFAGELRDNQIEPIKKCVSAFNTTGGGILCLPCGAGKTASACYLISKMRKKTLVIVHLNFLVDQWIERINQFLPNAKVGRIVQKKVDVEGNDIVIGMLKSLSMRDYGNDIYNEFGMCIIDEAHVSPCNSLSNAYRLGINCRYMLALSATPIRQDGLSKVLKWYVGDFVFIGKKVVENNNVEVRQVTYISDDPDYTRTEMMYNGKENRPKMINNIVEYIPRIELIIKYLVEFANEGRKILILSDRRCHLKSLYDIVIERKIASIGYYVGKMKQAQLKESEEKDIILGTFQMASTGMDIPGLNTLIMGTPKSNIEQSVGRIMRKKHPTLHPIIIDIVDDFSMFSRQGIKRYKFYKKMKYDIKPIVEIDGNTTPVITNSFVNTSDDFNQIIMDMMK
jgi:superfamily II DNA or RNA helicase